MTATIVGFVADLGGTDFEIRHATPVVRTDDGATFVVATPDVTDPSHLIPARIGDPNVHRLPESAFAPYSDVSNGDVAGQVVAVVGEALFRELQKVAGGLSLKTLMASWPVATEAGHRVQIVDGAAFEQIRRAELARIQPFMLNAASREQGQAERLLAVFNAVAPREDEAYLAVLGAFALQSNDADAFDTLGRRARRVGVSIEQLRQDAEAVLAEGREASIDVVEDSLGSAEQRAARQTTDLLTFIKQNEVIVNADADVVRSAVTRLIGAFDSPDKITVSQLAQLLELRGQVLELRRHPEPVRGERTVIEAITLPIPIPITYTIDHKFTVFRDDQVETQDLSDVVPKYETRNHFGITTWFDRAGGLTGAAT